MALSKGPSGPVQPDYQPQASSAVPYRSGLRNKLLAAALIAGGSIFVAGCSLSVRVPSSASSEKYNSDITEKCVLGTGQRERRELERDAIRLCKNGIGKISTKDGQTCLKCPTKLELPPGFVK